MSLKYLNQINSTLSEIKDAGLYKSEHQLLGPQGATVVVDRSKDVLNMCSNNYLGLSEDKRVKEAAIEAINNWGYGLSSVRFICGTQSIHKELEERLSTFLGTEDTILYTSCFDANGGLFETLLDENDAIISDELNHASIIDGIRLSKAKRFRYKNNNVDDLELKLKEAQAAKNILVATDGVFSMDGYVANLRQIVEVAKKYGALVMVDDSHAVGFVGRRGRGTPELHEVIDQVDILTGTMGKALGGASGGYTSGKKKVIELLRQRSRPYLFSNSVPPMIVCATLKVLDILENSTDLRDKLETNTSFFRQEISKLGLKVLEGSHPIVPIILGDAKVAGDFSKKLLEKGVYAVSFSYPVVPKEKARIRTQVSAAHSREQLKFAVNKFQEVKQELGI